MKRMPKKTKILFTNLFSGFVTRNHTTKKNGRTDPPTMVNSREHSDEDDDEEVTEWIEGPPGTKRC